MQIFNFPTVVWEPSIIELINGNGEKLSNSQVLQVVEDWLAARHSKKICSCSDKYLHAVQLSDSSVRLSVQWICKTCLPTLADYLESRIPTITRLNLGLPSVLQGRDSARFMRVPERRVQFEYGEQTLVPEFLIGQRSISIGEFQRFADEVSYVTRAEQEGDRYNFRNHFATWELRGPDKLLLPATYLCFEDVNAYCQWAKVRLPSEAEFLAASLIDEELYPEFSDEMRKRLQLKQKTGDAIIITTLNFTSTKVPDDKVVVRRGPKYFLIKGWEHETKSNRQIIKQDDFSLPVEFRVVLL